MKKLFSQFTLMMTCGTYGRIYSFKKNKNYILLLFFKVNIKIVVLFVIKIIARTKLFEKFCE